MLDLQAYYAKLAANETLSEDEAVDLLKELAHFRTSLAYLASCQAATLESLPKSASKSQRSRHVAICKTAAQALVGDASGIRYPDRLDTAHERCAKAATEHALA